VHDALLRVQLLVPEMRVAIIETTPYGGLLHYAVQFGDALAARGHDVDLIVPRNNELLSHHGTAHMRPVLTPTVDWTKIPKRDPIRILIRRARVALRLARSWARILVEARRGRYEAVVVNCDLGLTLTATGALLLTHLPGGPRVVNVAHNARVFNRWGGDQMFKTNPVLTAVYGRMVKSFDLVLLHGERSREEYQATWPTVPTAVIPHGGDSQIFAQEPPPPSDEERILFFGDWRKVKGLRVLMEAFDTLAARRPSVRLTIAGRPAPQDVDPELVRRWAAGHGERVKVIDRYVPIEDVPDLFREARVVVNPYIVGFQSGVLHLAMTFGRAAVVSDVGDLGHTVNQAAGGLVVPPEDSGALADALERVVSDPELAARLGAGGHRYAREHVAWDAVAEQVEAALSSLNGAGRLNGAGPS
jgi:glycosyltransferase involved in cell wall biosynthesis